MSPEADKAKVWELIKGEHAAMLVTIGSGTSLNARPMGCVQREFDGTLWFITFKDSPKTCEVERDRRVLVSYARSKRYEFVTVSGRANLVDDQSKLKELWSEGFRVWFPAGPESTEMALIAVDVDRVQAWTRPASLLKYAFLYVRARLTGRRPSPDEVVTYDSWEF
jgi:general stress protein 26